MLAVYVTLRRLSLFIIVAMAPLRGTVAAPMDAPAAGAAAPPASTADGSSARSAPRNTETPVVPPRSSVEASGTGRAALLDALGSADRLRVESAVASIEAPAAESGADPDVVFAAARACEDKLDDPARAMALYHRIVAEHPAARVAPAAERKEAALRELVGPHGEHAALAKRLAQLIDRADTEQAEAVVREAEQLIEAPWSGAARAAVWLADWMRRAGRFTEATTRYEAVVARWPLVPEARDALRGAAGCALDAHDWARAEALAARLPVDEPADRGIRDELLAAAARGRHREHGYIAAWLALAAALAGLSASLAEAINRTPPGARRAVLRPPIEAVFLAPVAAVFVGVAFTAHRLIAPAVATISIGGVALTWLSGATLEQLRAAGRARRLRSLAHIVACVVGVAALAYIALTRDNLLDALVETVRFGPDT
jgi:hypothetical protein